MLRTTLAGCAFLVLLSACLHQRPAPAPAPVETTRVPQPTPVATAPAPEPTATKASPADSTEAPRASSSGDSSVAKKSSAKPPSPRAAASGISAPAPAPSERPAVPATPALDLTSLEERLRETRAIGVFTKLSLKNQVDDLLGQFRAFHHGESAPTLTELRQRFELLLLKVVSLLQDRDAQLAAAIASSREAIWAILADPRKFAQV